MKSERLTVLGTVTVSCQAMSRPKSSNGATHAPVVPLSGMAAPVFTGGAGMAADSGLAGRRPRSDHTGIAGKDGRGGPVAARGSQIAGSSLSPSATGVRLAVRTSETKP